MSFKNFLKEDSRSERIAQTILTQLGGANKIRAMLGTKYFTHDDSALNFDFKGSPNTNYVKIKLNRMDYYDVTFYKIRGMDFKIVHQAKDVPVSELQRTFESYTQLRLSLGVKISN